MKLLNKIRKYSEEKPQYGALKNPEDIEISYYELETFSNALSLYLRRTIPNDKTPVIVYGNKNPYMPIIFLACAKAGHPYCPVESSEPKEKFDSIVEIVNPHIVLATEELLSTDVNAISLDEIKKICREENIEVSKNYNVAGEDVFLILFTSGSTGKPKGVEITAQCIDNFMEWMEGYIREYINGDFVFLNQLSYTFDLGTMELYAPLWVGGSAYMISSNIQKNFKYMIECIGKSQAVASMSTPYLAEMCMLSKEYSSSLLPRLRLVLLAGEVLENSTALKLMERFPNSNIVNMYGPTESTIAVTEQKITKEMAEKSESLPIGKPKSGSFIEIWNDEGMQVNDGELGEIIIKGDTVAKGYFKDTELTKKVFVSYYENGKEKKAYRTGDLGFIDSKGIVHYRGRKDSQIQLHGYRIELGDVESNFMKLDMISKVVVLPKLKNEKVKYLVAFVAVNSEWSKLTEDQVIVMLKEKLSKLVPEYMIPQKIKVLSTLPMNKNGKVDRRKLKDSI